MPLRLVTANDTPFRRLPIWGRYALATLLVLATLGVRLWADAILTGYPLLLFFIPVIAASALLDRGTGIYSTLLSALLVDWFFLEPRFSLAVAQPQSLVALTLFVAVGVTIAVTMEALRVAVERLTAVSERRDLLLREMSHRTKNNLQAVAALLTLERSRNAGCGPLIDSLGSRITTMARVHDRLRVSEEGRAEVDAGAFLQDLTDDLRSGLVDGRPITLRLELPDGSWPLAMDQAVPLGLIVNELITNAVKYAFPDGRRGELLVSLRRQGGAVVLEVADDGIGMADGTPQPGSSGLGALLVDLLSQQLRATVTRSGPPGTRVTVRVPREGGR